MDSHDPVYLIYYRYNDDVCRAHSMWWMNYIAYKLTSSPYIHVEIMFSDRTVYSIQQGTSITQVNDKTYARNVYECQVLYTTKEQSRKMRQFLNECMTKPSSFNYWGFYLNMVWPYSGKEQNKFFCSELVAWAMVQAGFFFPGRDPHTIKPGDLYELVPKLRYGGKEAMQSKVPKKFVF